MIEKQMRYPRRAFIASDPYGAEISDGDKVVGLTPLAVSLHGSPRSFTLSKTGYQDLVFYASSDTFFNLVPLNGAMNSVQSPYLSQPATKDILPVYLTAAAAVLAGASAAYFKIKADNFSTDYTNTGNNADLSRIHHNDTLAGISLVICQVNLLGLAYLLFSR